MRVALTCTLFFCLAVFLANEGIGSHTDCEDDAPEELCIEHPCCEDDAPQKLCSSERLCCEGAEKLCVEDPCSLKKGEEGKEASVYQKAIDFMQKINHVDLKLSHESMLADFDYQTNLTQYNKEVMEKKTKERDSFYEKSRKMARIFDWKSFEGKNDTLYRWFKLFVAEPSFDCPDGFPLLPRLSEKSKTMEDVFNEARVCPYEGDRRKKCTLSLDPDVISIMANSRNPDELKFIWKQFRDATGRKMRRKFLEHVGKMNKKAVNHGFSDYGHELIDDYESKDFVNNMEKIVKEIQPLYWEFHAYVRKKLMQYYNKGQGTRKGKVHIKKDGPIPAHLLGDLYAQSWSNIFDIVNPFPENKTTSVTEAMLKKNMKPLDLFIMAENFFVSIGLERMTPHFWAKSLIEKPRDREIVCHPTAFDMLDGKDFRIKMCTKISGTSLDTVHHEMGHVEYYMIYKDHPKIFRLGANPGFHEAIGDVISLSTSTTDYLKKMSLIDDDIEESEETDIIHLIKVALNVLPAAQYAYILEQYRYLIYNGSVKENELNRRWWKYRLDFQGVCPPVLRSERDFDPGAKYHVAFSVEYMRYFFANIFTFQIHKALCQKAKHKGPLHKCNIYNNKEAGNLLREILSLGRSKPWQEVMKTLTKETSELSSGPFLEYFQPLAVWLKKQNEGEDFGWKSSNPMMCPSVKKR